VVDSMVARRALAAWRLVSVRCLRDVVVMRTGKPGEGGGLRGVQTLEARERDPRVTDRPKQSRQSPRRGVQQRTPHFLGSMFRHDSGAEGLYEGTPRAYSA